MGYDSVAILALILLLNIGFTVFLVSFLRSHRFLEGLVVKLDNKIYPGINSSQQLNFRKRIFYWMIVVFIICGFNLFLEVIGIIIIAFIPM